MIADFLVDYQYLSEVLSHDSDGRGLTLVRMLCSLVDNDNARLIADVGLDCLRPLRAMAGGVSSDGISIEERQRKRIIEWFCSTVGNPHRFRKVEGYGAPDFWRNIDPQPFVVIAAKESAWGDKRSRRTIEEYFVDNEKERRRIRLGRKRSFGRNLESKENLEEAVARFCADDNQFLIIDRYAIGGGENIARCCSNISRWVYMISNKGKRQCMVEIVANAGDRIDEDLKLNITDSLRGAWQDLVANGPGAECVVRFRLIPGNGQTLRDDRFHDRFICSQTRVLGIGKGMDVYDSRGNVTCVNLQYCGRRVGDMLIEQLLQMQSSPSFDVILNMDV